jgi:hypothetical protein
VIDGALVQPRTASVGEPLSNLPEPHTRNGPDRPITFFGEIFCPLIQSLEETCQNSLKARILT